MREYNLLKNKQNTFSNEIGTQIKRRVYSASYKKKILLQASHCNKPGEIGALLRKEGLSSSTLRGWRMADSNGKLHASNAIPRGPNPSLSSSEKERIKKLEKENASLKKRLKQAEGLVELQKKIADILSLNQVENKEDTP